MVHASTIQKFKNGKEVSFDFAARVTFQDGLIASYKVFAVRLLVLLRMVPTQLASTGSYSCSGSSGGQVVARAVLGKEMKQREICSAFVCNEV
jgi:hypothetical protein